MDYCFVTAEWAEKYRRLPEFLRENLIRKTMERLPEPKRHNNFMGKLKRFLLKASMPYGVRHYNWINIFRDNEKSVLFSNDYKEELNNKVSYDYLGQFIEKCASEDTVDKIMYADINTNLVDD